MVSKLGDKTLDSHCFIGVSDVQRVEQLFALIVTCSAGWLKGAYKCDFFL